VAFQVRTTVNERCCVIEVTHPGRQAVENINALLASEHSLRVVRSLADDVGVDSDGLLVKVTKKL
jgi:hypothetical protein